MVVSMVKTLATSALLMMRVMAQLRLEFGEVTTGQTSSLRQRDHAAPELQPAAGLDVVFAREGEAAVVRDAKHDEAGRQRKDFIAAAHRQRRDAGGHQ